MLTLPVSDLLDAHLLLVRAADPDHVVMVDTRSQGRLVAGRIMLAQRSSGRNAWFWTVTGPAAPQSGVALAGEEADLEGAKAAFRRSFDRVLAWAARERGGVLGWYAPAARTG